MPSAEEAAAAGFFPEDYDIDDVEVWPENWSIWVIFQRLSTQWRFGMNGATGLDYAALYPLLDRLNPDAPAEWERTLDEIRLMESVALKAMRGIDDD